MVERLAASGFEAVSWAKAAPGLTLKEALLDLALGRALRRARAGDGGTSRVSRSGGNVNSFASRPSTPGKSTATCESQAKHQHQRQRNENALIGRAWVLVAKDSSHLSGVVDLTHSAYRSFRNIFIEPLPLYLLPDSEQLFQS